MSIALSSTHDPYLFGTVQHEHSRLVIGNFAIAISYVHVTCTPRLVQDQIHFSMSSAEDLSQVILDTTLHGTRNVFRLFHQVDQVAVITTTSPSLNH